MRKGRLPHNDGPHSLYSVVATGVNRFKPGKYVCRCGEELTSINAYERHRAAALRATRESRYSHGSRR